MTANIRSPDLCSTAAHRNLLDEMFDMAGIKKLERELSSHFRVLDGSPGIAGDEGSTERAKQS